MIGLSDNFWISLYWIGIFFLGFYFISVHLTMHSVFEERFSAFIGGWSFDDLNGLCSNRGLLLKFGTLGLALCMPSDLARGPLWFRRLAWLLVE